MTSNPRVAVVVPTHPRPELTPEERISLRHLMHYLGRYDKHQVAPRSSTLRLPGFTPMLVDDRYFGSADANKALLLSRSFYEAFEDYDYILIHHLDALVFSDELEAWCRRGYDYIGAPWLKSRDDPTQGFSRVGNGGLSLRRIEAFLRVFDSRRHKVDPEEHWRRHYATKPWAVRAINLPRRYLKRLVRFNGVRRHMAAFRHNEDHFWADWAARYDPEFRVAPPEVAVGFAFECAPRYCYERNGRRLPFGCHAWTRYDRAFWEPFLLGEGETDPRAVGAGQGSEAASSERSQSSGRSGAAGSAASGAAHAEGSGAAGSERTGAEPMARTAAHSIGGGG